MMKYEYAGLNKEVVEKAKSVISAFTLRYEFLSPDVKIWRPVDGKNRIRIIPCLPAKYEDTTVLPQQFNIANIAWLLWVHRGIGDDRKWFLCKKKMRSEPCVICKALAEAENGDRGLAPTKIVVGWVWDRTTPDREASGLRLGLFPYTLFNEILNITYDPETDDVIDIFHPQTGRDIYFLREIQANGFPSYSAVKYASKPSPVPDILLEQVKPISSIIRYTDDESIKLHLYGVLSIEKSIEIPEDGIEEMEELSNEVPDFTDEDF